MASFIRLLTATEMLRGCRWPQTPQINTSMALPLVTKAVAQVWKGDVDCDCWRICWLWIVMISTWVRVLGARRATTHLYRYTLIYNQSTRAVFSCQVELQGQRTGWSLDLHLRETSTRSTNLCLNIWNTNLFFPIKETILVRKSTMPFHLCSITIPQPLRPIPSFHTTIFSIPHH